MFRSLEATLRTELISFIENIEAFFASQQVAVSQQAPEFVPVIPEVSANATTTKIHDSPKIGRNDPCPCGSGKKVKKCDCKEYAHLR